MENIFNSMGIKPNTKNIDETVTKWENYQRMIKEELILNEIGKLKYII